MRNVAKFTNSATQRISIAVLHWIIREKPSLTLKVKFVFWSLNPDERKIWSQNQRPKNPNFDDSQDMFWFEILKLVMGSSYSLGEGKHFHGKVNNTSSHQDARFPSVDPTSRSKKGIRVVIILHFTYILQGWVDSDQKTRDFIRALNHFLLTIRDPWSESVCNDPVHKFSGHFQRINIS